MPIVAAHMLLYTPEADALRTVLRDVLGWDFVEDTPGWLIFKLPPAEVAVHPAGEHVVHELYLMCDDIAATVADLEAKGVAVAPVTDQGWGLLTTLRLPSGGDLGLYEPRHPKATEL